jgi:predicted membrane protein
MNILFSIIWTLIWAAISYVIVYQLMMFFSMRMLRRKFRICRICKEKKCVLEFTETKSDICNQCFNQIVKNKSRENITLPQP